ncbi:hypothetical protein LguiB_010748 [Lonicera macranthoides]
MKGLGACGEVEVAVSGVIKACIIRVHTHQFNHPKELNIMVAHSLSPVSDITFTSAKSLESEYCFLMISHSGDEG